MFGIKPTRRSSPDRTPKPWRTASRRLPEMNRSMQRNFAIALPHSAGRRPWKRPRGAYSCYDAETNTGRQSERWIGFLNDIFYDRSHIAGPGELSIPFLLDKNPTVVPVGSAGEGSKCARTGSLWSCSLELRAAPSACVGKRYSAPQIVWNKSTRRVGERGGARDGRPRWVRILTITGGSSLQVPLFAPYFC